MQKSTIKALERDRSVQLIDITLRDYWYRRENKSRMNDSDRRLRITMPTRERTVLPPEQLQDKNYRCIGDRRSISRSGVNDIDPW